MYRLTRHKDYLAVIIFFALSTSLVWYLLFKKNIAGSSEKLLAAVLSSLSIVFGITQFFVTQINIRKKKFFDLRYGAYKEIVAKVESISQMVIEIMVGDELEPHALISKLMNTANEFVLLNNLNEEYLFPGLTKRKSSVQINLLIKRLLTRTDKFRKSVEMSIVDNENFKKDGVYVTERMNWHNDMRKVLKELHENRYRYYSDLRFYL